MHSVIPTVGDCMTPAPHVVAPYDKLAHARRIMQEYGLRHLPVVDDGKLIGVVSDRDMSLVQSLAPVSPDAITVEDAMTSDPYTVEPETLLQEVARKMAERKVGSAIVVDHGKVAGVFTTTDALHALADSLEGKDLRKVYESVTTAPPGGRRAGEGDLR
jgi:acetoin utilization protein AcuB